MECTQSAKFWMEPEAENGLGLWTVFEEVDGWYPRRAYCATGYYDALEWIQKQ